MRGPAAGVRVIERKGVIVDLQLGADGKTVGGPPGIALPRGVPPTYHPGPGPLHVRYN